MKWFTAPLGLLFCLLSGAALAQDVYRPSTVQAVTVASSSTPADAVLGSQTFIVRLVSTVTAHVAIGVSPQTATTSNMYLPPNVPELFVVSPGQHIAVIRVSSDGTLNVTEMTR